MPCDSGPPRCGHWSRSANTSPVLVRNTAIAIPPTRTHRAPRSGSADTGPKSTSSRRELRERLRPRLGAQRREFLGLLAGRALRPGVGLRILLRFEEPLVER